MSKEYNLISDFDYRIIAAFFAGLDRQGPGDDAQTRRALSFIDGLPPRPRIADIGCGTGRQTAVLASALDGPVTAVDLLPEMIEGLHRRMETEGRTEQVTGIVASMLSLPFAEASFDLLWAEGSIYNIGFEKGLTQWRGGLQTPGGQASSAVPQTRRVHRRHGVFVAIVRTARRNGILPRQLP